MLEITHRALALLLQQRHWIVDRFTSRAFGSYWNAPAQLPLQIGAPALLRVALPGLAEQQEQPDPLLLFNCQVPACCDASASCGGSEKMMSASLI